MGRADASVSSGFFGADDGGLLVLQSEWQPRQNSSNDDLLFAGLLYGVFGDFRRFLRT